MIIVPLVSFDIPARAEDMTVRLHNRYVKEAIRETMAAYHKKYTRKRFQLGSSKRYGYAPRSRKYVDRKKKKKGHTIPMLYSGKSRDAIAGSPPKLRVGGSAEGGKKLPTCTLFYRLPFSGGTGESWGKDSNRVVRQIIDELSRWAPDEVPWACNEFLRRYMEKVNKWRGRRKRVRKPKK